MRTKYIQALERTNEDYRTLIKEMGENLNFWKDRCEELNRENTELYEENKKLQDALHDVENELFEADMRYGRLERDYMSKSAQRQTVVGSDALPFGD